VKYDLVEADNKKQGLMLVSPRFLSEINSSIASAHQHTDHSVAGANQIAHP
jgi:hypothetical protein